MLFQHDPNQPIGVWSEIREDGQGLYVKGKLTTEVSRAREVLSLMRAGALDGLSIGYRTVRGKTDAKTGIRSLMEVDLWEISVVTFPMLPEARVSSVKAARDMAFVAALRRGAAVMWRAASRNS
jgi:HK97 family phage prohead protease